MGKYSPVDALMVYQGLLRGLLSSLSVTMPFKLTLNSEAVTGHGIN